MRRTMQAVCVLAVALLAGHSALYAQGPVGTGFAYQGQLKDGGIPADGDYDFLFRLFDDPDLGSQVGGDVYVDDWPVAGGLFTVPLDFGDGVFTGDAIWLEAAVRPGESGNPYSVLSPRQPLTATPYALYALDGPGVTGFWEAVGDNIVNTNSGFVGINRTATVTGNEYFGIQTPTGAGQYGGMYIRTDSATGKPFYGYDTGTERAWTYLDGSTGNWYLYNDGARITVEDDGNVGVGTTAPAAKLHIAGTAGVDGIMFPDGTLQTTAATGGGGGYWTENGDDIYNTNTGRVGVGTTVPQFNLHVYDMVPAGLAPPTTFGVQWRQSVLPVPPTEWFYFAVGGYQATVGSGTRLIRESGTELHFQTQDEMYSGLPSTQMMLDAEGKVGIGTMDPISMLEVESTTGVHGIRSTTSGIPVAAYRDSTSGTWPAIHAECASLSSNATAIRAYLTSTSPGSGSAAVSGHNRGTTLSGYGVKGSHAGYGVGVYGVATNGIGVYGTSTNGTYAGYFDGTVNVDVLEISGADVAEKFPVSEEVEPGMVVAIDPKQPGKLCLARGTYNRCVAGVVSGANDLPAGAVLGHLPGNEDAPPIALAGRVWVYCDATENAIEPGDLLTTSSTPGHAMKVTDHVRAQGAVIGKAMTRLEEGTGLVLVLVSLQ